MISIKTHIKNTILLLSVLLSTFGYSQSDEVKEVERLLEQADIFNKNHQDLNEFNIARQTNILAKETGDEKLIARSYYYISRSLFNLGLEKQSLSYINKASSEENFTTDPILNALFIELKANIYKSMRLKSQSINEFRKAFRTINSNENEEAIQIKARIYANLAQTTSNLDSAYSYYQLQFKQLEKLPEKKYFPAIAEHYSYLGYYNIDKEKPDLAFYYFEKSYQLKLKYKDPIVYEQYIALGDYYIKKGNYSKALTYFLNAEENVKLYSDNSNYKSYIYQKIAHLYDATGDIKKKKNYQTLATQANHIIIKEQNDNMDHALNTLLQDKKKEFEKHKQQQYIWISGSIAALLVIFFIIYSILRKNLKHKEIIISEVNNTLQDKDEIIIQQSEEAKELQQKINNAYNEVIELAKNNDPVFYFRFQEVYPDFQQKILESFPGLRNSELTLCAYTFLGFTIKDIADYTFKSINTVRNRKQNLRKKFNIPTDQDMGIWLRNFINPKQEI